MENVAVLKLLLPTVAIVGLSLFIDSYVISYLPRMNPIGQFKSIRQNGNILTNIVVFFLKWYGLWVVVWILFHLQLLKQLIQQTKCSKTKREKGQIDSKTQGYQTLSTAEQSLTNTEEKSQKISIVIVPQSEQSINSIASTKEQLIQSFFYPYLATLTLTYCITFFTLAIVQSQMSLISSSFKNGSRHSRWMGITEYYSLDFFHNVPQDYQNNQELMDLFDMQDKALGLMNSWIGSVKLFFSLFYLFFKSFTPMGLILIGLLIVLQRKIYLFGDASSMVKSKRILSFVRHFSSFYLFNIIFILFLGFSLLSAAFLQLKTNNNPDLCLASQLTGGFYLRLDKRIQSQIFALMTNKQEDLSQKAIEMNKHQILFVFQNLCEILSPYYHKVINLQGIFLFSMRLCEVFFGFTLIFLLYSKLQK